MDYGLHTSYSGLGSVQT